MHLSRFRGNELALFTPARSRVLAIGLLTTAAFEAALYLGHFKTDSLSFAYFAVAHLIAALSIVPYLGETAATMRLRWLLVFLSMISSAFWSVEIMLQLLTGHPFNGTLTFTWSAAEFALRLLAIFADNDPDSLVWVKAIDATLAVLLCAMTVAQLLLPMNGVRIYDDPHFALLVTGAKLFLAAAATIACLGCDSRSERRFGSVLTTFLWLDAVCFFLNAQLVYGALGWKEHSPLDVLLALPSFAMAWMAVGPRGPVDTAPPEHSRYFVRSAMPLFLDMAALMLAWRLIHREPVIALGFATVVTLLTALRIALMQSQYMQSKDVHARHALQDVLTKLGNRRAFDQRADEEWMRARRSGDPLALLLIDIDHFKPINDTCGHAQGDRCLALVGATLAHALPRMTDCVFRYGGDEFAALLPFTAPEGAQAVAERIRRDIAQASADTFSTIGAPTLTVSVGAAVQQNATSWESLAAFISAADEALYRAKDRGRDCVELSESPANADLAAPI